MVPLVMAEFDLEIESSEEDTTKIHELFDNRLIVVKNRTMERMTVYS